MKFCARCGSELSGPFCGACGWQSADRGNDEANPTIAPATPPPLRQSPADSATATPRPAARQPAAPPLGTGAPARFSSPLPLLALGLVLVAAIVGLGGWQVGWFATADPGAAGATITVTQTAPAQTTTDASEPTESQDASESSPTESTPTETTSTTPSPQEQRDTAFATLEDMVSTDSERDPVRGQWVAQLSSKFEGVVDTSQQATPFTLPQILAEVERLRSDPAYGELVRVVHQGDWAGSEAGATPMWVTFADLDAVSRDSVVRWCSSHFSQRGQALLNVCYPRQLKVRP